MNAIKEFLRIKKMTQAQFGAALGVRQGMVSHWIKGRRPVSPEKALLMEEKFGIDAEAINPRLGQLVEQLTKRPTPGK